MAAPCSSPDPYFYFSVVFCLGGYIRHRHEDGPSMPGIYKGDLPTFEAAEGEGELAWPAD